MRRRLIIVSVPFLVAASCTSNSSGAPGVHHPVTAGRTAAAPHSSAWPQYHRTALRAGTASFAPKLPLHSSWTKHLDGAVYGEVLSVNDELIAATENDSVYGLDPSNGKQLWRRHLGHPEDQGQLPCGNVNPLGITGTPAYDTKTGSVFVVTETSGAHHTLWALNADNGKKRWHKNMDILPGRDRHAEQERSALLVAHGRVFTAYGGLYGDCGNYIGYLTSTLVTGKGKTHHYAVPSQREAGIWSPAGPVEGANGDIYVAAGNGAELNGKWDKSDSVTELTPDKLHRVGVFAPSVWKTDNQQDLDLGSSSPVPVPAVKRMVVAGKNNHVYLLKPNHLGGVGGDIASLSGCSAFGGAAVSGNTVVMPCIDGVRALTVGKHSLHWLWNASGVYGSPIIANSKVYVADRNSGTLRVLNLATGQQSGSIDVGSFATDEGEIFSSSTLVNNDIYVGTATGVTAVHGS
jgi:outer membrane protein assembly factor BamB